MKEKEDSLRLLTLIDKIYSHPSWLFDIVIAFIMGFLAHLFFSNATSPLYSIYAYSAPSLDNNFIVYSASLLLNGKTPYLDFFDHKGLYHLYLNALGLMMGKYGVYILESLFFALTLLFLLRSIRLLSSNKVAPYVLVILFSLIIKMVTGGGNLMGEWLTPYLAIFLYFFILAKHRGKTHFYYLAAIFMGLMAGFSLNSRPLECLWSGCAAIYLSIIFIKERKFLPLFYCALISIFAMGIVIGAFSLIAYNGGYLQEMYSALFESNFAYVFKGGLTNLGLTDFVSCLLIALFLITISILVYVYEIRHKTPSDYAFFLFFMSLLPTVMLLPIARFYSYFYSFFPIYALSFAYFFHELKFKKAKTSLLLNRIVIGALSLSCLVVAIGEPILYYSNTVTAFSNKVSNELSLAIKETIPEEDAEKEDAVLAIDCNCAVYLYGGFTTTNPYFANQSWWGLSEEGIIEYTNSLLSSQKRPKWLIVANNDYNGTITNFGTAVKDNYVLQYESPYEGTFNIYLSNQYSAI